MNVARHGTAASLDIADERDRLLSERLLERPVPQKPALTPSQLRELRSNMEEDFALLLHFLTHQEDPDVLRAENVSHPDSGSEDADAVLNEVLHSRLTATAAAIRRFDTGLYGTCARCARHISFRRLTVMPEATLCIACDGGYDVIDQTDRVDVTSYDSFPASDPPSWIDTGIRSPLGDGAATHEASSQSRSMP